MPTNISDIPQIPGVDLQPLQNDLHIGFTGDIAKRIQKARWTADDRRRQNRRVAVKSTVVGRSTSGRLLPAGRKNHTYATAAGWTWARLIADGKAALAVSDDTNPPRILSTDKKALKAGGLMLAQDAQPVLPTDPVDVALDYQLVPID